MTLLELLDLKRDDFEQMGERAIESARRDGVPAYYVDASLGQGIIRELPDGTRERIERKGSRRVVVERYEPRS